MIRPDKIPVPQMSTMKIPLTRETAGKIADALGLPMTTRSCRFDLDWSTAKFLVTADHYVTDEQGKVISEVLTKAPDYKREPQTPRDGDSRQPNVAAGPQSIEESKPQQ